MIQSYNVKGPHIYVQLYIIMYLIQQFCECGFYIADLLVLDGSS